MKKLLQNENEIGFSFSKKTAVTDNAPPKLCKKEMGRELCNIAKGREH